VRGSEAVCVQAHVACMWCNSNSSGSGTGNAQSRDRVPPLLPQHAALGLLGETTPCVSRDRAGVHVYPHMHVCSTSRKSPVPPP